MARATEQEQKGSTGVSEVTAKFTRLDWGFAEITRHDNGSDLFLMARDARRFDLGLTVGAQVKAGPSYFSEEARGEDGKLLGWWFRDPDGEHVNDWLQHGLPHLIVIHDLDTLVTYWVHVTEDVVVSTGKGSKVLVPVENTVDEEHREALLAVAATQRPAPMWEGSAWSGAGSLASQDVLRHALVVPRLIAPHPNAAVRDAITPAQGVALLMQARLNDLSRFSSLHDEVPTLAEARGSEAWPWRFFGILGERITSGNVDILQFAAADAPDPAAYAAATVTAAAGLMEDDRPDEAILLLESALRADTADPVDHAWLTVQRARACAEVGRLEEARAAAAEVQSIRATHPYDVTATAIAGVGARLLFGISHWEDKDLPGAIEGADTAASWWRQQTRSWGLASGQERTFRQWARDTTSRFAMSDESHDQLLSAALTANLIGSQSDWRSLGEQLGRDTLLRIQRASDPEAARSGLSTLRLAGAEEAVKLATRRLVADGPASAVATAAAEVRMDTATKTTGPANLTILREGGATLDGVTADRTVGWLLGTLVDPTSFLKRTTPSYSVTLRLVDTLAAVLQAATDGARGFVVAFVLGLPPQGDALLAQSWASVVRGLGSEWKESTARIAGQRARLHHDALKFPLIGIAANYDPAMRLELAASVQDGSFGALNAFGDVRGLPGEVVPSLIQTKVRGLQQIVSGAPDGAFTFEGQDFGRGLALLNLWHPDEAAWNQLLAFLGDGHVSGADKRGALQLLARLAERIPADQRTRLANVAAAIANAPGPPTADLIGLRQNAAGPAAVLVAALDGYSESQYAVVLQRLLSGCVDDRAWAAALCGTRGSPEDVGVLLTLVHDTEPDVRASAADRLAYLVATDRGGRLGEAGLSSCLLDPGMNVPMAMARRLADTTTENPIAQATLVELTRHAYSPVRRTASRQTTPH